MRRVRLDHGLCRGVETGPITACVVRANLSSCRPTAFRATVRDDVEALAEQAEHEGDDGPSCADGPDTPEAA